MLRPLAHWLLLLALVAMWGSAFLLIKVAVASLGPSTVVAGRLVVGAAALLVVVYATGRRLPRASRHWAYFSILAVTGNCLPFWLIAWGEQSVGAGLAGILMAIMPLSTLMLAHFFVAGERMNPKKVLGFGLGFLGIVLLVGPDAAGELKGSGTVFWAEMAMLAAAVSYAGNSVLSRNRPRADPIVAAAATLLVGSIIMTPVALLTEQPLHGGVAAGPILAVVVLGLFCTALATVTFFKIIDLAGPTFLSLINYLIPLWALLGSMVFLGEKTTFRTLIALAFILAGVALAETLGRRSPPT